MMLPAMMLTASSISPMQTSAIQARARREAVRPDRAMSIGLLQPDQHGVGREERDDDRDEIDDVAQIDDAAGDRREMAEQARAGDSADEPTRRPALQQSEHDRRAGDRQHEDERRSH